MDVASFYTNTNISAFQLVSFEPVEKPLNDLFQFWTDWEDNPSVEVIPCTISEFVVPFVQQFVELPDLDELTRES